MSKDKDTRDNFPYILVRRSDRQIVLVPDEAVRELAIEHHCPLIEEGDPRYTEKDIQGVRFGMWLVGAVREGHRLKGGPFEKMVDMDFGRRQNITAIAWEVEKIPEPVVPFEDQCDRDHLLALVKVLCDGGDPMRIPANRKALEAANAYLEYHSHNDKPPTKGQENDEEHERRNGQTDAAGQAVPGAEGAR